MTTELRGGPDPDRNYRGTPNFSPRTKLYLGEVYWGASLHAHVIGLRRGSRRYVNCVVNIGLLTDIREKLIYSPSVLAVLQRLNGQTSEELEPIAEIAASLRHISQCEFGRRFGTFPEHG